MVQHYKLVIQTMLDRCRQTYFDETICRHISVDTFVVDRHLELPLTLLLHHKAADSRLLNDWNLASAGQLDYVFVLVGCTASLQDDKGFSHALELVSARWFGAALVSRIQEQFAWYAVDFDQDIHQYLILDLLEGDCLPIAKSELLATHCQFRLADAPGRHIDKLVVWGQVGCVYYCLHLSLPVENQRGNVVEQSETGVESHHLKQV